jgi:hypothetical protein
VVRPASHAGRCSESSIAVASADRLDAALGALGEGRATRPPASGRCARLSTGATTCSTTPRGRALRASRCSLAGLPWRQPRRSPAPGTARSSWAAMATPWSTSPARHPPRARSTIPSSGCSCRGTSDCPRCWPATRTPPARRSGRGLGPCRNLVYLPFASEGLAGLAAVSTVHAEDHRAHASLEPQRHTATARSRTP